jgi:predicted TIM-barrel fold metal-dependent hydrolase
MNPRGKAMIIDFSAHHIPQAIIAKIQKTNFGKGKQDIYSNADPDFRLGLMDKYGVDVQALSLSAPRLLAFNNNEVSEICRLSNEENYALCKAYPKRFVNICIISLLDVNQAMRELDYDVNELDCRGVTVATNQRGKGLDSPEYYPFYEKVVKHGLPILLHPTNWEDYPLVETVKGWRMMQVFGWPFDTTQAVWRLIFGGVIDRFPSLKIVTHHLGAMFPYFGRRVEQNFKKFLKNELPRELSEYWINIYGDTAMDGTDPAFPCGYAFFGPDRMVFGTDYPYGLEEGEDFIRENLAGVRKMAIPEENKKKILGENAKKLLKIK